MSSTHARIRNEIYEEKEYLSKKPVKLIQLFYEYAPTLLHYYILV